MEVEDSWLRLVRALGACCRVALAADFQLNDIQGGTMVGKEQKVEDLRACLWLVVGEQPGTCAGGAPTKAVELWAHVGAAGVDVNYGRGVSSGDHAHHPTQGHACPGHTGLQARGFSPLPPAEQPSCRRRPDSSGCQRSRALLRRRRRPRRAPRGRWCAGAVTVREQRTAPCERLNFTGRRRRIPRASEPLASEPKNFRSYYVRVVDPPAPLWKCHGKCALASVST